MPNTHKYFDHPDVCYPCPQTCGTNKPELCQIIQRVKYKKGGFKLACRGCKAEYEGGNCCVTCKK